MPLFEQLRFYAPKAQSEEDLYIGDNSEDEKPKAKTEVNLAMDKHREHLIDVTSNCSLGKVPEETIIQKTVDVVSKKQVSRGEGSLLWRWAGVPGG